MNHTLAVRRAFQLKDGGSSFLRKMTYNKLGFNAPANFHARVKLPMLHAPRTSTWSMAPRDEGTVTIDVTSNDELVLQLLRLHLFGLVHPLGGGAAIHPASLAHRTASVQLGTLPGQLRSSPVFLDESVEYFRRVNARRFTDVTDAVLRPVSAKHQVSSSNTEQNDTLKRRGSVFPHERWSYGTLADGLIALRIKDHPNLEQLGVQGEIARAKLLRLRLDPLSRSPYIAARDDATSWAVFGGGGSGGPVSGADASGPADAATTESSLIELMDTVFASAISKELSGVWLRGDAICNTKTGDAVVVVGPPRSGKTSLALHCVASHKDVAFVASQSCFVFVDPRHPHGVLRVAGLPISPSVKLGSLMGTVFENPCLAPPEAHVATAAAHNALGTIWSTIDKAYRVNITEAFGADKTATSGRLRGIVCLDWNTQQLANNSGQCGVEMDGTLAERVQWLQEDAVGAFASHPLLEWKCYDRDEAPNKLKQWLLGCAPGAVAVPRIGGHVAFDKATRYVVEQLLGMAPDTLMPHYQRGGGAK